MEDFIYLIDGEDHSRVHKRAFEHDGCIIDIGCASWNWSNKFLGEKRVIGVDPFETTIPQGAELFKGAVGATNGITWMNYSSWASSITNNIGDIFNTTMFPLTNYKTLCKLYNIDKVSVLKMNIEGSEYPLLHSMDTEDFENIDQIIISFHNWLNPRWECLTRSSFNLLGEVGFELHCINWEYRWYLGLKKY
jgi:hypothetical protein